MKTVSMIAAHADLALSGASDGGLAAAVKTPCRSLILRKDAGPGLDRVALGVLISTTAGEMLVPGTVITNVRLDF